MIKTNLTTFPVVKVSLSINMPSKKTIAGARLIYGYAVVISNFVIANAINIGMVIFYR